MVNAFETAILGGRKGIVTEAISRFQEYRSNMAKIFGDQVKPGREFVLHQGNDDSMTLEEVKDAVREAITE